MEDRTTIIANNPIGSGLDTFRSALATQYPQVRNINDLVDNWLIQDHQVFKLHALELIGALRGLPTAHALPSSGGDRGLINDMMALQFAVMDRPTSIDIKPLMKASLASQLDDTRIWNHVYEAIAAVASCGPITPPRRAIEPATKASETPISITTASVFQSAELRDNIDRLLRIELDPVITNLPRFYETYFADVPATSDAVFQRCIEGDEPLFSNNGRGWKNWPAAADQASVQAWFRNLVSQLATLAKEHDATWVCRRKLWTQSTRFITGSRARRALDIGFISTSGSGAEHNCWKEPATCNWSQVMVPGELKSNPDADDKPTWIQLANYAREILSAQWTRRFALGFTLCGRFMRIWAYDRSGGLSSCKFDINENGRQFVTTILAFLNMDDERLGFDPTIREEDGKKFIEINKEDGSTERLILKAQIYRARSIVGRATTCWTAYRKGEPESVFIVKDSWQHPEREDEGVLLLEAAQGDVVVVNVARYYHHEIVQVRGTDDDILNNIRRQIHTAGPTTGELPGTAVSTLGTLSSPFPANGADQSPSTVNHISSKRPRDDRDGDMPPPKRSRGRSTARKTASISAAHAAASSPVGMPASSPAEFIAAQTPAGAPASSPAEFPAAQAPAAQAPATKIATAPSNRVHRRVIVQDFGKPIYQASTLSSLLEAFEGCIQGHESLYKAGFLHRDISINNMIINEDGPNNSPWSSFLIDLDLAIKTDRIAASGAGSMTGTLVFMGIGRLDRKQHSFMHDLESFFWVLFWICIHYDKWHQHVYVAEFDLWNRQDIEGLMGRKMVVIRDESALDERISKHFQPYYLPLHPLLRDLRKILFPNGRELSEEDEGLYAQMKGAFRKARESLEGES